MKLFKKLLNRLNGLQYSREYLCLAQESLQQPLHAFLIDNGRVIKDITNLHFFVGYSPLIFAFSSSSGIRSEQQTINIVFSLTIFQPNGAFSQKDAIAMLDLKKIHQIAIDEDLILFYEGVKGRHRFVSGFNQFIMQLYNRLYNQKQGNVFLRNNLYKQVQIAYAIPRKICLITVGSNRLYNHFPTDLHGGINNRYYIISLRYEGKACQQVEVSKRIALSDMQSGVFKKVYALGKNHMQPLKEASAFDFDLYHSKNFNLPLPKNLISYKELELENSFIHGIHKLLLFKIVYQQKMNDNPSTLAHIHNCYATWRDRQGISSNYLLK